MQSFSVIVNKQIKLIMKLFKVLFLSAIFSFTFFAANAANINPKEASKDLQKQVSELVLDADVFTQADAGNTLKVRFMVMDNNEIIVLSTDNENYDDTMKSILNYKLVDVDAQLKNKIFILPITLRN